MIKVRFAPSPTGIPHIGNTRTALYDFLFAKKNNGKFILRIEDTDQKRIVKGAEEAIDEILDWLGITPDEKFRQSERLEIYKDHASKLLKKKIAYKKEGAVYVHVQSDKDFSWTDAVGNKKISFNSNNVEDFVILKSDGFPTYHLANVVDDYLMRITHVIRGEEWISSTPKHLFLYESFGWKPPLFVHLPVILGPDRSKLSKRHGAKSVLELRDEGYLKEAILNFMALLGWNPGKDKEIMSLNEMISLFRLEDINVANPVFDINKLNWMNGVYIRKLTLKELKKRLKNFYVKDNETLDILKNKPSLIALAQTRMSNLSEFKSLVINILPTKITPQQKNLAKKLIEAYKPIDWSPTMISGVTIAVRNQLNVGTADVYTVLTGNSSGLPFEQKAFAEGKDNVIDWLEKISPRKK